MIKKTGCVSVTEDGVLANNIANQGYDGLTKEEDDEE